MNIPRFSNPHLCTAQFETISRSDLLDSDVEDVATEGDADLQALEALVKSTLGEFTVSEPPCKKRKKKHADAEDEKCTTDVVVPFRLTSSAPIREYNLAPKPRPEINNEGPPCEDDETSAQLRHERAAAAAVELDQVVREGPEIAQQRRSGTVVDVETVLPDPPPPLALLERSRSIPPVRLQLRSSVQPSPHETKIAATLPVLTLSPTDAQPSTTNLSETARRRMRRQKKREHEKASIVRPQAKFYRPSASHGAVGYAMGFEGSWAVDDDEEGRAGYVRDSMKKGQWVHSVS